MAAGIASAMLASFLAISAHVGVERQFDSIIQAAGENLFLVAANNQASVEQRAFGFTQEDVDLLKANPAVKELATTTGLLHVTYPKSREEIQFLGVSGNYFDVLRIPLRGGRSFKDGESGKAVLGDEAARLLFAGDPIGQTLKTDFNSYEIVGVLEPVMASRSRDASDLNGSVMISVEDLEQLRQRLRPRQSSITINPIGGIWLRLDSANAAAGLGAILKALGTKAELASLSGLYDVVFKGRRYTARMYEAVAAILLLAGAACSAALTTLRVRQNLRDIAIRRALGTARRSIVTSMVLHLGTVTCIGGAVGWMLFILLRPALRSLLSIPLPLTSIHIIGAFGVAVVVAVFGLLPISYANRATPADALRAAPLGFQRQRSTHVLKVATVAALFAGLTAVVFSFSFAAALRGHYIEAFGMTDPNVIAVSGHSATDKTSSLPTYDLMLDDLQAIEKLHGVRSVTGEDSEWKSILIGDREIRANVYWAANVGTPFLAGTLIDGRLPTAEEFESSAPVAIVGPDIAQRMFPGEGAIGKEIVFDDRSYKIIGILAAPASKLQAIQAPSTREKILVPAGDLAGSVPWYTAWVNLSPAVDVGVTLSAIQATLGERHHGSAPAALEGPATELAGTISTVNGLTLGLTRFGLVALVLGALALGSVFWLRVMQEYRDLGIRRALGATCSSVFWLTYRLTLLVTAIAGAGATLVAALGVLLMDRLLSMSLPFPAAILIWSFISVALASAIAGAIPSLRIVRLSPADAIRLGGE
jgi:putative ABC transport system permease protein